MNEKDFIICSGRIHICRLCRRPVFSGFEKLETVDGYTAYDMQSELTQEAYILVDGGEKDGQIASINLNSVLGGEAEFAIVKGKTL